MRRAPHLLLLLALTLAAVPAEALPSADLPVQARPVASQVRELPLDGVDPSGLAQAPAPEVEDVPGRPVSLSPAAVTTRLSTAPFSALGVTWTPDERLDVAVQVRTRTSSGWSRWTEVEVQSNSVPDPGAEALGARAGSDPLYVGPSTGVQVRVDAGAVRPRDLQLALIDPGTSDADGSAPSASLAGDVQASAVAQPPYVSRAGWGANESYRTCVPGVASGLKGAILHTTATSNAYTATESPAIMRSIYSYHTRSLGWCDIGYNFLVDKFGVLYEGRYGGVSRPVIGAHTGGFNTGTVGVSMIGNHDLVAPTSVQKAMVERVFAYRLGAYGLNPLGTTTYTSGGGSSTIYPAGTVVTKPVISGHRDYSTKSCPGNYAYPVLPSIRSAVSALLGSTTAPLATATKLTVAASPASLVVGASTTVSGRLTTTSGTALGGRAVQVHVRPAGSTTWSLLTTRTTASDGSYSLPHAPTGSLTYSARFTGTSGYSPSTAEVNVTVSPAKATTTLAAAASPATVVHGSSTTVRGRLTQVGGAALAGRNVEVHVRYGANPYALVRTVTTASDGTYSLSHAPRANATYGVRFRGDAQNLASGRDLAVKVATRVSANLSSNNVRLGTTVRLSGSVTPAHPGEVVQRQQLVNGVWTTLATATLSSTGTYSFPVTATFVGKKQYRVVKPADVDHVTGTSTVRTLTVR